MAISINTGGVSQGIGSVGFSGTWQGASGGANCIHVAFEWGYSAFSFETPNQNKSGSSGSFSANESVDKDRAAKVRGVGSDACAAKNAQGSGVNFKTFADQATFGLPSASSITENEATVSVNYTPNTNATPGQGGSTAAVSVFYREQGSGGPFIQVAVSTGQSGGGVLGQSKQLTGLGPGRHYEYFFRAVRDTSNLQLLDSQLGQFTTDGDVIAPPGPPPPVSEDEWLLCYRNQTDMDRMSEDSLRVGADYRDMDPDLCRIEILTNVAHTFEKKTAPGLENEDFYFDFDIGAAALFITRRKLEIAAHESITLSTDFTAAAAITTIAATYDENTHLWTVARTGGGVFNIRTKTGANKERSAWGWLGFENDADHTGSSSYTAENPTFTDPDQQHFVQCFSQGYKDASGDYTGTPGSVIRLGPDIVRVLLERHLRVPSSRINAESFEAARAETFGAMPLVVHLTQQEPAAKVFGRFENGGLADIVTDGEGVFHWVPYSDATVRRQFFDRDFLSFSLRRRTEHVISGVRVFYRALPHDKRLGATRSVERHDATIPTKYGRTVVKDFETYLDHQTPNAEAVAAALLQLGTADPRIATFQAKSKLMDLKVADVIEITKADALDPLGRLDAVPFKISKLRRNRATWVSQCEATEYFPLT